MKTARSLRCLIAFAAVVFLNGLVAAHPGNGIVVARDGAVYFADVANETIWRVAPDGTRSALVRDRWTHSLFLANDGTLFYEREEPGEGITPGSFWKITAAGEHTRLVAPEPDRRRFTAGSFAVDDAGAVYFPHAERDGNHEWRTRLMRRTVAGEVTVFTGGGDGPLYRDGPPAVATIRIITAMTRGPDGAIYFADRDHVRRVAPDGTVTTLASGLIDARPADPPDRRGPPTTINRLYGLAVAADGAVYVAYQAGRRVMRIEAGEEGRPARVVTVHRTTRPWSPLGVAVTADGTLYVLESGSERGSNERGLRVRRKDPQGGVTTMATVDG